VVFFRKFSKFSKFSKFRKPSKPKNSRPDIVSDGGGSTAHIEVNENTRFVTDVETHDDKSTEQNGQLSYVIAGGADAHLFDIDRRTGKVFFKEAPDFENPRDHGKDNTYEVKVKVWDAGHLSDSQLLKISVKDVLEDSGQGQGNVIKGDSGDNFLHGTIGADVMFGAGGNDVLFGGEGDDILNGTDSKSRGVGEVDNLKGQAGADKFILGDAKGSFYLGNGFGDFAIIQDFTKGEDQIVLSGSASNYKLVDGCCGEAFILTNSGDAIARIVGQSSANLDLSHFEYV